PLALVLCTGILSCGEEGRPGDRVGTERSASALGEAPASAAPTSGPTLNTYIGSKYVQIDQLDQTQGSVNPNDANLFIGNDPADGTASVNFPAGGAAGDYIDWNDSPIADHLGDHLIYDFNVKGPDASSFPGSDACVGSSQVLSKMDLTYVGAANNNQYADFAVQRSNN